MKQGVLVHPLRGASSHYKGIDIIEKQSKVSHLHSTVSDSCLVSNCCLGFVLQIHSMQDKDFSVRPSDDWLSSDVDIVELSPGDVMYHNGGVWHRVEAIEDSLSVSGDCLGLQFL